jgi:hypothetical protein
MLKTISGIIFFIVLFAVSCFAQDTLPNIAVKNYNGKIVISWKNSYGVHISTINIQRSSDSLRNFTTIATVLNPLNKDNGIVDGKAPSPHMFYRVFIAFEGGTYIFSKSHRPVIDTFKTSIAVPDFSPPPVIPPKEVKVTPAITYIYGKYIYTGKDNNVIISLPNVAIHKYSIKFFDLKDNPLFEISKIPEPYLILDKVNFIHAGWFKYQLFDDGVLLEKYKIFIPKDAR